jgi:hypothetical protein
MGLSAKRTAGEPLVGASGHEANQNFLRLLQVHQELALELAAAIRILRQVLELPQRQRQIPFADLLPERLRAAKEPVRQALDVPGADLFAAQGGDKLIDRGAAA